MIILRYGNNQGFKLFVMIVQPADKSLYRFHSFHFVNMTENQ